MDRFVYGFAQHACEAIGRPLLLPVGLEKYNSKVIAAAKCQVCGKTEFEKTIDKSVAASKGFYMTV